MRRRLLYVAAHGAQARGLWYDGVPDAEADAAIAAGAAYEIHGAACGCAVADNGTVIILIGSCREHAAARLWKPPQPAPRGSLDLVEEQGRVTLVEQGQVSLAEEPPY